MRTLRKKIKQISINGMGNVVPTNSILRFSEKPTVENPDNRLGAHDLFSLFTASIIEEKITFTR